MRDFLIVFTNEFYGYFKSKAIRISTIIMILVAVVGVFWPNISGVFSGGGRETPTAEEQSKHTIMVSSDQKTFDYLKSTIPGYTFHFDGAMSEAGAGNKVNNGDIYAAIFVSEGMNYKIIRKDVSIFDDFKDKLDEVLTVKAKQDFIEAKGFEKKDIETLDQIHIIGANEITGKNFMQTGIYAYILLFLMYMSVVLYGQTVSSSIVSEKSSRTMELLITSVKPVSLMFGKVIAAGAAGLLQIVLFIGVSMGLYQQNSSAWGNNEVVKSIFNIPGEILIFGVIFFIIGFFIFAFLYGAIGSLLSRMEDINTAVMPVMLLLIGSFFLAYSAMMLPDAGWVKVCSFIPIFTPLVMFVRVCVSSVPLAESIAGVVISAVTALLIGWGAAKIYRVGVLMYGKPPKIKDVLQAVRQK